MKLYIVDHGWEGCEIYIGDSFEKAYEVLLLPMIEKYKILDKNHNYEKSGPNNPWINEWKYREENPRSYIDEHEIKKGLYIEFQGGR